MRRPPPESLRELEIRAEALAGRTVGELARALDVALPEGGKKGFVGQLLELALGADPNAGDGPDFSGLAVELKSIPVNQQGKPVESTFVCSIAMAEADRERWESSRLRRRLGCVLFIPVEAAKLAPLPERKIGRPVLFRPSPSQEAALRADWEDLMGAIGAGRGGSLTAHAGKVLQVRPKAENRDVRTLAPGPDGPELMLPLGFYLRTSFTSEILGERLLYPTPHGC